MPGKPRPVRDLRITVFVCSPTDVDAERRLVRRVADEVNLWGERDGFHVVVRKWETHARPGGGRPQARVTEDLRLHEMSPDDVFVGLLWKRFGTPTGKAPSGTIEEFEIAHTIWKRLRRRKHRPEVFFYFRKPPATPAAAERTQLAKVLAFKRQLHATKSLLTWDYGGPAEFERLFRRHLESRIRDVLERRAASKAPPASARAQPRASMPRVPARPSKAAPGVPLPDVPRRFTDEQRRAFIAAAYRSTLRYFQSAARALNRTITHARVTVTKLGDTAFYAEAFANGERRTGCRIWLSDSWSRFPQIAYAEGRHVTADRTTGMNDSASVEDGHSALALYLSGMDCGRFSPDPRGRTPEQVAEHFWRRFTAALEHI
jgi:hypothetical protein